MKIQDGQDFVWQRIGDKWLVGKVAASLFAASALTSVSLSVLVIKLGVFPPLSVLFLVPSGLFLISGMERYWTKCDDGSRLARKMWFFVLTFGVWFGASLYCVFVYLPQVRRDWRAR
jgi:hypothetical protein